MDIILDWKSEKDDIYGRKHYAAIWQNQTIEIKNNGENFFNAHLLNKNGYEIEALFGDKTLKKTKQLAREWIEQQIQSLILENF